MALYTDIRGLSPFGVLREDLGGLLLHPYCRETPQSEAVFPSSFLICEMKIMQKAVEDRRGQDAHRRDEDHAGE